MDRDPLSLETRNMVTRQTKRATVDVLSRSLRSSLSGCRAQSSSTRTKSWAEGVSTASLNQRWLSDLKKRVGRCIMFGLSPEQIDLGTSILQDFAQDWRSLVVGSEGFLTDRGRVGLRSQAVVWGEQDPMGHVNNVTYVRYAETGRCNWMRNIGIHFDQAHKAQWAGMLSSKSIGLILKSITVDFKFPMTWPDRVSVYHKLRSRPTQITESMVLDVMILSDVRQRPAARCVEDVVVYDYGKGQKTSLVPFMLTQLEKQFELQEAAKAVNSRKVESLLDRVRQLEQQSWDRPGAEEDHGIGI